MFKYACIYTQKIKTCSQKLCKYTYIYIFFHRDFNATKITLMVRYLNQYFFIIVFINYFTDK